MIRRRLFTLVGLVLVFVITMSASVSTSSQGEFLNKEHGITFIMIEKNVIGVTTVLRSKEEE